MLIADYLTNRSQRVKTGGVCSPWNSIVKGIPQGSIMGPIIFNVFTNDIFTSVKEGTLFNYADDNSVLVNGSNREEVISSLKASANSIITWCTQNQMEANPSKFQIMIADDEDNTTINITNSTSIKSERNVKLLGVTLDNQMNFSAHVSELLKKSSRQLNCLKRVAYPLEQKIKLLLYKSFVAANFNYCPAVWHNCGAQNTAKLEKLQFRALKFVFNDYTSDYASLLLKADLPSLEVSRLRAMAIEVFKICSGLSPNFLKDGFPLRKSNYNLRSGRSIQQQHARTTHYGLHSFKIFGAKIWNNLSREMRDCTDLSVFKRMINTWYGFKCNCNFCHFYH